MENIKKIKLIIGLSYLILVCLFLYFLFSNFSIQEITSYDFLRDNRTYFIEIKNSNLFLIFFIEQLQSEYANLFLLKSYTVGKALRLEPIKLDGDLSPLSKLKTTNFAKIAKKSNRIDKVKKQ